VGGDSLSTGAGGFDLEPNERELITDFRVLPEDDQSKFANEIALRASTMRKYLREQFLKMGVDAGTSQTLDNLLAYIQRQGVTA